MLTLQPWYELGGLWERIVLPAGLTPLFLVYPPHRVNDPRDSLVIANGQFILIRREVYQAIGGHEAVRHRMMDDFSLAELVKRSGHRLFIAEGMDVMRVRLYTNLREIWSGALKAAVEISGGWLTSTIALIANLLVNILPFALLIWAIVAGNRPTALVLSVIVAFQLLYYALVRMAAFRAPPWTAITYPFGGLLITAILLDGMIRLALGHDIRWKDRPLIGVPRPNIRARLSDRWKR
jgi:chlorobactene glucosyltransferase